MKIEKLVLGPISVNCYLISTKKSAIVIDPGYYSSNIVDFLNSNKNCERKILITHAHFDHIGGALQISSETGVKIGIGKNDAAALGDGDINLSSRFGFNILPFEANETYSDNEEFTVGDLSIKVFETPGHTKGSVCYLIGGVLFSGDTVFFESYGRTDFPGGSIEDIKQSFYRLTTVLPENTEIYAGHGPKTDFKNEIQNNPIGYISAL